MNKFIQNKDSVSVCYKQACINAIGKHANVIACSIAVMFVLIGIASIAQSK